jgi:hypothetical protein
VEAPHQPQPLPYIWGGVIHINKTQATLISKKKKTSKKKTNTIKTYPIEKTPKTRKSQLRKEK